MTADTEQKYAFVRDRNKFALLVSPDLYNEPRYNTGYHYDCDPETDYIQQICINAYESGSTITITVTYGNGNKQDFTASATTVMPYYKNDVWLRDDTDRVQFKGRDGHKHMYTYAFSEEDVESGIRAIDIKAYTPDACSSAMVYIDGSSMAWK